MVQMWGMAKDDLYFRLRLPEDIKNRVQEAAEANHRSMTAEIISRLEASFAPEAPELASGLAEAVSIIERQKDIIDRQGAQIEKILSEIIEAMSVRHSPRSSSPSPKED